MVERFYKTLNNIINERRINNQTEIITSSDFNSPIGRRQLDDELIIGPYQYEKRNGNEELLEEF